MKELISFPHLGNYYEPVKYFIKGLTNIEVKEAPKITKKTIMLGSKYAPDTVCVPFKYNLGNFIESLDNHATILFQAGGGCRYRYYAEVQEQILKDLGYNFKFYKLISHDHLRLKEVYKIFKELNANLQYHTFLHRGIYTIFYIFYMDQIDKIIRKNIGFEKVNNSFKSLQEKMFTEFNKHNSVFLLTYKYFIYKRRFKMIKVNKPKHPLKVGIIGELYTAMEPYSTYYLECELAKYNIEIKRFTNLSYLLWQKVLIKRKMLRKSKKYVKYSLGADGLDNVYRSIYLGKHKYDGIIHTKPAYCTPEIGAIPIIRKVCNDYKIPIIFFSFDSETSEEGLKTRLEAFYDLIKYKKEDT